jgi:hypothetical protein
MNSKIKNISPMLLVGGISFIGSSHAVTLFESETASAHLNTSLTYTLGWRAQARDNAIGNNSNYDESDYKFDQGDLVSNRTEAFVTLEGKAAPRTSYRLSGLFWKDFAYDDHVESNPAYADQKSYSSGHFDSETRKYNLQGGELFEAFLAHDLTIGQTPVTLKAGRIAEHWGNAKFFYLSSIGYSQSPFDYRKAFGSPGIDPSVLYLPRNQVMATAGLRPDLSVSFQYMLEFRPTRYGAGGTYLSPLDFLFSGPDQAPTLESAFGGKVTAGDENRPKDINDNFGVKADWSPDWAQGRIGLYYRQFDDAHPWIFADMYEGGGARIHQEYARKTKMFAASYDRSFGPVTTGFEVAYRKDTALNSSFENGQVGVPYTRGATGDLITAILNGVYTTGSTPMWDDATLIGELTYAHLIDVTKNESLFNGIGFDCVAGGSQEDGCATVNAYNAGFYFEPHWMKLIPGVDISAPASFFIGLKGNPAYAAGGFVAEDSKVYTFGVKATYKHVHSATLQYNGFYFNTQHKQTIPNVGEAYSVGDGPIGLNDKGWISLQLKTSF